MRPHTSAMGRSPWTWNPGAGFTNHRRAEPRPQEPREPCTPRGPEPMCETSHGERLHAPPGAPQPLPRAQGAGTPRQDHSPTPPSTRSVSQTHRRPHGPQGLSKQVGKGGPRRVTEGGPWTRGPQAAGGRLWEGGGSKAGPGMAPQVSGAQGHPTSCCGCGQEGQPRAPAEQ